MIRIYGREAEIITADQVGKFVGRGDAEGTRNWAEIGNCIIWLRKSRT